MTAPPCCGRISAWAGGPQQPGCAVCPNGDQFWRRRPDGGLVETLDPADSYLTINDEDTTR